MPRYKAAIIDVDDTLSMTEEGCFYLENEVLAQMGRKPQSREIHRKTWGNKLGEAMLMRSPGVNLDEFWKLMPNVHRRFIAEGAVDVVSPENLAAIDILRSAGMMAFVLTNRTLAEMEHFLDPNHDLATRIDAYYYQENLKYHKPDPRVFSVIEQEHRLSVQDCVYIGDSPSDAAATTEAGMDIVVNLESGLRTTGDFSNYNVVAFINKFADLPAVILK